MQLSFIKRSAAIAIAACSMAFATQALAYDLDTDSPSYLGNINDGIPSSEAQEAAYINTLLTFATGTSGQVGTEFYTRSDNACATCPTATATGAVKDETGGITITGSFTYILAKYDQGQAGAYVWYVGDLGSQTFNLPATLGTCGSRGCGLSHFTTFGSGSSTNSSVVAEPGSSSLAVLALGLLAAGFWTRRKA